MVKVTLRLDCSLRMMMILFLRRYDGFFAWNPLDIFYTQFMLGFFDEHDVLLHLQYT